MSMVVHWAESFNTAINLAGPEVLARITDLENNDDPQ